MGRVLPTLPPPFSSITSVTTPALSATNRTPYGPKASGSTDLICGVPAFGQNVSDPTAKLILCAFSLIPTQETPVSLAVEYRAGTLPKSATSRRRLSTLESGVTHRRLAPAAIALHNAVLEPHRAPCVARHGGIVGDDDHGVA